MTYAKCDGCGTRFETTDECANAPRYPDRTPLYCPTCRTINWPDDWPTGGYVDDYILRVDEEDE